MLGPAQFNIFTWLLRPTRFYHFTTCTDIPAPYGIPPESKPPSAVYLLKVSPRGRFLQIGGGSPKP